MLVNFFAFVPLQRQSGLNNLLSQQNAVRVPGSVLGGSATRLNGLFLSLLNNNTRVCNVHWKRHRCVKMEMLKWRLFGEVRVSE